MSRTDIANIRRAIKEAEFQYNNMKAGEGGGSALSKRIDRMKAELKVIKETEDE